MKRRSKEQKADDKILDLALNRYANCEISCSEVYKDASDDIDFSIGNQWASNTTSDRKDRPCLVENRLAGMIHQVANDNRQNRPMMKVVPVDDTNDPDVAEVINGLLRHIQYQSDSETAFDTAFDNAVRGGIGWYRIITDYIDDESFEQEIILKRIEDIQAVKIPYHLCKEIDFRDMPYCFIESRMSKDDFEKEYPDADIDNWKPSMSSSGDAWVTEDSVRICEYFTIEKESYQVYLLSDRTITNELPDGTADITVIDQRTAYKRKIKWYKITATQILERNDFPGKWIPLIPIIGEEAFVRGKRKFISMTRHAKDPQKMLNYWRSSEAERIALAPKQKFIVASSQIENYELEWANANKSNSPVLHYNPVIEGGILVPAPSQLLPTQIDMAIVNAARESIDAIKATTGIYDASLGSTSNERSGKAILARQREGNTSNFHFTDNAAKAMKHCCRIIVDMIPEIYDTERAIRILGNDMKEKVITINKEYDAEGKIYDLTVGRYDVLAETGPSYLSKRQETADTIRNLGQNDPVMIQTTRDLLAKYIDMPLEIVERLRKTIDPKLIDDNKNQNPAILQSQLQQAQAQLQQLDQVIQKMSDELQTANLKLQSKSEDNQVKLEIAQLQAQIKLLIEQAKIKQTEIGRSHEIGLEAMRHAHNIVHNEIAGNQGNQQQPEANSETVE
jgi:hypothetical protein